MTQGYPDPQVYDTTPKLLKYDAVKFSDDVAFRQKNFGIWEEFTGAEFHQRVRHLSLAMQALEIGSNEVVALLGNNNVDWLCAEIAAEPWLTFTPCGRLLILGRGAAPRPASGSPHHPGRQAAIISPSWRRPMAMAKSSPPRNCGCAPYPRRSAADSRRLTQHKTAIDCDCRAGHIRRCIGGEEQQRTI